MFKTYANIAIDQIQMAKKDFVKQTVKHEAFAKIANDFVDAQTEYTKRATSLFIDTASDLARMLVNPQTYKV